jgi:O-acetyl-ADP-ribose deacetylase (regulator of RNase III)
VSGGKSKRRALRAQARDAKIREALKQADYDGESIAAVHIAAEIAGVDPEAVWDVLLRDAKAEQPRSKP